MKFIGLSLSFCVKDILDGKKKLDDVLCIVSNTAFDPARETEKLLDVYCRTYWKEKRTEAREILSHLLVSRRLIQPRLIDPDYSHRPDPIWIEVETIPTF